MTAEIQFTLFPLLSPNTHTHIITQFRLVNPLRRMDHVWITPS